MKKVISKSILALILVLCVIAALASPNETNNSAPKTDDVQNPIICKMEPAVSSANIPVLKLPSKAELELAYKLNPKTISASKLEHVMFDFEDDMSATYYTLGFGDKYGVYRFENTNIVVFQLNIESSGDWYMIGEDTGETEGPSTVKGQIGDKGQFLALSSKYMLFLTEEGKVARDLEERIDKKEDGIYIVHDAIPFDELSEEAQDAFVYPCSYEVSSNIGY